MSKQNRINRVIKQAENGRCFKLSDDEVATLRPLEQAVTYAQQQERLAYDALLAAATQRSLLQGRLLAVGKDILLKHNIDVDDPASGKWNLDTIKMVYSRTD